MYESTFLLYYFYTFLLLILVPAHELHASGSRGKPLLLAPVFEV